MQKQVCGLAEENADLRSKLATVEKEKKKLEQMLARTETTMHKVRMNLTDVAQSNCKPRDAHKAQFKEGIGTGYGAHESGQRLLHLYAAEIGSTFSEKLAMTFCGRWSSAKLRMSGWARGHRRKRRTRMRSILSSSTV